jgi:hypothetical protein
VLLAETLGVWLKDGDDLAKTMAHVDRRLRMIEEWSETFRRRVEDETEEEKEAARGD